MLGQLLFVMLVVVLARGAWAQDGRVAPANGGDVTAMAGSEGGLDQLSPQGATQDPMCRAERVQDTGFVVCVAPAHGQITAFLNGDNGRPHGQFTSVIDVLSDNGQTLGFAMNGGGFHIDRQPVGLFVAEGETLTPLNQLDGRGNFYIKPNGVFYVTTQGRAAIASTPAFADAFVGVDGSVSQTIAMATQSGPLLVMDGELSPRLLPASTTRFIRNGVGVTPDGQAVFVMADTPLNLYAFGLFFRDQLGVADALYLDGAISRVFAPELQRHDRGARMGPIVGVVFDEPTGPVVPGAVAPDVSPQ